MEVVQFQTRDEKDRDRMKEVLEGALEMCEKEESLVAVAVVLVKPQGVYTRHAARDSNLRHLVAEVGMLLSRLQRICDKRR